MKSILQSNQECFLCHKLEPLHIHHVVNGTANRKKSEKWGLTVWLCPTCHEMIHHDQERDEGLKRLAQSKYELLYGHNTWMDVFGKNYL